LISFVSLVVLLLAQTAPAPARPTRPVPGAAASAEDRARAHYEAGLLLFREGDKAQALEEFELAHELAPRSDNLFMMAQCQYHLGRLKEARTHYQEYLGKEVLKKEPDLVAIETAKQRMAAIDRRPSKFVINTVPDEVDITLEAVETERRVFRGQAPNEFEVPQGRYRITASKANYVSETREVAVDIVETKPLFFKLEPVPARLEIRTRPLNATLYIQGNRARNPYLQTVSPGSYEVYAEATDYQSRSQVITVAPGEKRAVDFQLRYVQRSGRPELIGFWTAAGAMAGGTAVLARLNLNTDPKAQTVTASAAVVTAAALVGGVTSGLVASSLAPDYLRDNLALFRMGAAWIGAVEGATLALTFRRSLASGWVGGATGLGAGALVGTWLDGQAPNYGRVAIIQSGAAIGGLAAALAVPAFGWSPQQHTPLAVFGGLNLGLGLGLALAYLPDQRQYGPTWQRVLLVDVAAAAGAFGGALVSTMQSCLQLGKSEPCNFRSEQRTAKFALLGGGVGLAAGWFLTRNHDRRQRAPSERAVSARLPLPTLLPVMASDGRVTAVPGLGTGGHF
jgi:hypothetical protein